jgi:hypothetical protein
VTSNWEILVNTEAIIPSPIIYHVDKELLQMIVNINYSYKYRYTPWMLKLWELYQIIKNGYIYDEDTSYNHILTSIREKYVPKNHKHLRDEFCKLYEDFHNNKDIDFNFEDCIKDFHCEYDTNVVMALLYCWCKMNKTNYKDWIGISDYINDVDDNRLKNIL